MGNREIVNEAPGFQQPVSERAGNPGRGGASRGPIPGPRYLGSRRARGIGRQIVGVYIGGETECIQDS